MIHHGHVDMGEYNAAYDDNSAFQDINYFRWLQDSLVLDLAKAISVVNEI